MGEQAKYILNGHDCEQCGQHIGEGEGFPRKCSSCKETDSHTITIPSGDDPNPDIRFLIDQGIDVSIEKFSQYHYRIANTLDIWPTKGKYHNLSNNVRGKYYGIEELLKLIEGILGEAIEIAQKNAGGVQDDNEEKEYLTLFDHYTGHALAGLLASEKEGDINVIVGHAMFAAQEAMKHRKDLRMKTYYFTFGTNHIHHGMCMANYWIQITAPSYGEARTAMFEKYTDKWAFQYDDDSFDRSFFPGGMYEAITVDEGEAA